MSTLFAAAPGEGLPAIGMPGVRRAIHAEAGRWCTAALLLEAVPGADPHRAAEAQGGHERPGLGGAGGPFPDAAEPDDAVIEAVLDRIVAAAEARSQFCPWCLARLENCSAFCSPVCEEDYRRKLMPLPFARSTHGSIIPDMARIVKRKKDLARAAAWRAEHGPTRFVGSR
jgi:hypothetical protein